MRLCQEMVVLFLWNFSPKQKEFSGTYYTYYAGIHCWREGSRPVIGEKAKYIMVLLQKPLSLPNLRIVSEDQISEWKKLSLQVKECFEKLLLEEGAFEDVMQFSDKMLSILNFNTV